MKLKLITLLFIASCFFSFSQKGQLRDKIKAQKIAFITEKLSLTSDEAQVFWPIYNRYEENTAQIKSKDLRSIKMEFREAQGNLSKEKADELLDRLVKAEIGLHEERLKLVSELKSVVTSEKIIKLKAAEEEFNRMLLSRLREERNKRQKP